MATKTTKGAKARNAIFPEDVLSQAFAARKRSAEASRAKVLLTPKLLQLFDPEEQERAVIGVSIAFKRVREGDHCGVYVESFRKFLVEPLHGYIQEFEKKTPGIVSDAQLAAALLALTIEDICECLETKKTLPAREKKLIAELQSNWDKFIIAGAAYRMYHDLPKANKQRLAASKKPRKSRQKIDPVKLDKEVKSLLDTGRERHEITGILLPRFGVSEQALRRKIPEKYKK
jgi:hypothetical protein